MNDKYIDTLLDDDIPEAGMYAKKAAISSAVNQFSQKFNQENFHSDRPMSIEDTSPSNISNWSHLMNFLRNPNAGKAFATVIIAVITFALVDRLPKAPTTSNPTEQTLSKEDLSESTLAKALSETRARKPKTKNSSPNQASNNRDPQLTLKDADSASYSTDSNAPELITPNQAGALPKPITVTAEKRSRLSSPVPLSLNLSESPSQPMTRRPDLREEYVSHKENTLKLVRENPISTFSADVDTASYSLIRSQLRRGFLPQPVAVRSEEVINYFNYDYPYPESKSVPFRASVSVLDSPWNESKKLIHIGIKGYDIKPEVNPDSNLVFLLDVSGSMSDANKLPLVKQSIVLLLNRLKPSDTVSIVVYAGAAGVVLEPTQVKNKGQILTALKRLSSGGSTAGGAGIELAYQLAEQHFDPEAVNRIILATDGDFNVGLQSNHALKALVEHKRKNGVFLSVLGFGRNNYQDDMMQTLVQNGNGVAVYIDSLSEAKKVFFDLANSTLFTIAKDVKFQIEFNPHTVSDYRLVGYETRHLNREDFNNDKVDAGDIGSGHTVTAIYEISLTDSKNRSIDPLRYESEDTRAGTFSTFDSANEYGFLKMRYKLPDGTRSNLIEQAIEVKETGTDDEVKFSIAAASFAQYLKGGKYIGDMNLSDISKMAKAARGEDPYGYRSEFIQLIDLAGIATP